jgi:hypothetical protein
MFIKRKKDERGQALVEFSLVFPVLFLIYLVCFQFGVLLDKGLRTEMAVWPALRGSSMPTWGKWGKWYDREICVRVLFFHVCIYTEVPEGLYPRPVYSISDIKNQITSSLFKKDDVISLKYTGFSINGKPFTKAQVICNTPYLYKGSDWKMLQQVFSGIVSGNTVELKSAETSAVTDTFTIWPQ